MRLVNDSLLDKLIQEEIKIPGTIEHTKNILVDFGLDAIEKIPKIVPKKDYTDKLKEYGYQKNRNRWYLNTVILEVLEGINNTLKEVLW